MTATDSEPTLFDYFQAIRSEHTEKIKSCLASGKWDINFQNAYGHSALHTATIYNKSSIVGMLACYNADPNLYDQQGFAPLHIACKNAHFGEEYMSTIKILLQCGADVKAETKKAEGELGDLPSYAAGRKALDLVQQDKKADVTALLNSVQKDEAFIQKLRATYGEMTAPIKSQSLDAPAPAPAAALTPAPAPALAVAEPAAPLDMAKLPSGVMMFVGQGTQFVGMARDVIEKGGVGKGLFDRASAVLGYDLAALCLQGPADKLQTTVYSQPAVMVSALAALEELKQTRPDVMQGIGHMAGFSLGEITALVAAEAISFEDGLRVVKARAEAMHEASETNPGGMGSITGLDDEALKKVIAEARAEAGGVLEVANYLFPKGRVVSGDHKAVDLACKKAEPKAIKCQKLLVGGAFHTSHMQAAKEAVAKVLGSVSMKRPNYALYSNVTAKPYQTVDEMKTLLVEQVVSGVRWEETVMALARTGGTIMEVGAGEQLKSMMKRIDKPAWQRTENVGHWIPPKK